MGKQYEIINCPFCHKGEIQCVYFPGAWSQRSIGKNSLGKGRVVTKSSDVWVVQSGCNACGKNQEEVEAQLKKDKFF